MRSALWPQLYIHQTCIWKHFRFCPPWMEIPCCIHNNQPACSFRHREDWSSQEEPEAAYNCSDIQPLHLLHCRDIRNNEYNSNGEQCNACLHPRCFSDSLLFATKKKKPSTVQITGILVTFIGVVITVIAAGVSSSLSISGYAALVIAVISYALYSVSVDKASDYSEMEITYAMLEFGALLFVLIAIAEAVISGSATALMLLPFKNRDFLMPYCIRTLAAQYLHSFSLMRQSPA